jgi:hypothetical protein
MDWLQRKFLKKLPGRLFRRLLEINVCEERGQLRAVGSRAVPIGRSDRDAEVDVLAGVALCEGFDRGGGLLIERDESLRL